MAKYHQSGTICRATKRGCPLGEGELHFDSKEAAMAYAEKQNTDKYGETATLQKPKKNAFDIVKTKKTGNGVFVDLTSSKPIKDPVKTEMFNAGKKPSNFKGFKEGLRANSVKTNDPKIAKIFKTMR